MTKEERKERHDFAHFQSIPTRWMDNDVYGHVNNVVYYSFFDTVINTYLVKRGGLDIAGGAVIGVCAESNCRYWEGFAFPDAVEAGLRVAHLGRRSVRYEIGLFKSGSENAIAEGSFVHVFVARDTMRPVEIPANLRDALSELRI